METDAEIQARLEALAKQQAKDDKAAVKAEAEKSAAIEEAQLAAMEENHRAETERAADGETGEG